MTKDRERNPDNISRMPSGRIGKALGFIANRGGEKSKSGEVGSVSEISSFKSGLHNKPGRHNIEPGKPARAYFTDEALVESTANPKTRITNRLNEVIFAGDTVFAVVSQAKPGLRGKDIIGVAVVALPYGPHLKDGSGNLRRSPVSVITKLDFEKMRQPGAYSTEDEQIIVGRDKALEADRSLSREHFKLTVRKDGTDGYELSDLDSTNGTQSINMNSLGSGFEGIGIGDDLREQFFPILQDLVANPTKWDASLAGKLVMQAQ